MTPVTIDGGGLKNSKLVNSSNLNIADSIDTQLNSQGSRKSLERNGTGSQEIIGHPNHDHNSFSHVLNLNTLTPKPTVSLLSPPSHNYQRFRKNNKNLVSAAPPVDYFSNIPYQGPFYMAAGQGPGRNGGAALHNGSSILSNKEHLHRRYETLDNNTFSQMHAQYLSNLRVKSDDRFQNGRSNLYGAETANHRNGGADNRYLIENHSLDNTGRRGGNRSVEQLKKDIEEATRQKDRI